MNGHRRRGWRRRLVVPLAVLAVAGGSWAAYAETTGAGHDYRTAAAKVGDVSATVELSGTVSASGKADLVAGSSGEVVAVPVAVGQQVRRGQVVARLDQSRLIAAVKSARASLAKATAQLASDEDAQTSSVATTSTTSTGGTTSARATARLTSAPSASAGPTSTSTVLAAIKRDQAAVTKAQTVASTALATASDALEAEETACTGVTSSTPSGSASDGSTDAASATPSTANAQVSDECQTALGAVRSAQAAVSDAQADLSTALDTLTADLATASASTGSQPAEGGVPTGSKGGGVSTPSGPSRSSGSSGTSVTAATLARDQASIDQADADLVSAIAARRAAVVRAPAAGQIRSLSVAKGDAVSTGDAIAIVVGKGLTTVEIAATRAQAAELEVGGTASVTPVGSTTTLTGSVSRIAHVPTSSSASAATSTTGSSTSSSYAVEVTLAGKRTHQPPLGMPVAVSAVVGTATKVVTVPASAVSNGSVEVLRNGVASRIRVTTGVVGTSTIQVMSGVSAGDEVVLADLDEDLPSSDSSGSRGGFGGSGSFGGSSTFGGGPMGVPPGMG